MFHKTKKSFLTKIIQLDLLKLSMILVIFYFFSKISFEKEHENSNNGKKHK
jgi:hypothetical protein